MSKRIPQHLIQDIQSAVDETLQFVSEFDYQKYL